MDDNSGNRLKNQSGPIFESVPVDEVPQAAAESEAPVPSAAETPDAMPPAADAFLNAPPPELTGELPPLYEESKGKFAIIGATVLLFLLIFGGILTFLFMRARGRAPAAAPRNVKLVYWGLWEDAQVMRPLIDEYQQKNPGVTITYEAQGHQDYRQKLLSRSANKRGPDIFRFHNTWLPQLRELAAPLPPEIMSAEEFGKTFYPIHVSDLTYENQIFGMPTMLDGIVMMYNASMFERAGVSSPPTGWIEDLQDAVSKMTVQDRDGTLVTSGIAMGSANNIDHFSEIYGILLLQNGGSIFALDSTEAADALKVYREFGEKNIWNDTLPNSIEAFKTERVAIIFAPSWQLVRILGGESSQLPIRVAPVPNGLDGQPLSLATYWVEGVSRQSENQVEAWKFLKYLTEKETLQKMNELQRKTRGVVTVSSRQDMKDIYTSDPLLAPVVLQANAYRTLPIADRTFDKGLNDEIIGYLRNAVNATAAGVSYSEALKTASQGFAVVFNRYNITAETFQPAR